MNSMTGYGKSTVQTEDWTLDVEVKSVNNRYLDIKVRLPYQMNALENKVQNYIKTRLDRGRVDVFIHFNPSQSEKTVSVNFDLLKDLIDQFLSFKEAENLAEEIPLNSFFRIDGVVNYEEADIDLDMVQEDLLHGLQEATQQFLEMRAQEGEHLKKNMEAKIDELISYQDYMKKRSPQLIEEEHQRLKDQVQELLEEPYQIEEALIANELAIYAQKTDIDEEIVRLESHIHKFKETIDLKGPIGKTLDFIIQEMNREVNTMSSKSNDFDMRNACVEQKAIIEQLREQVQNVE